MDSLYTAIVLSANPVALMIPGIQVLGRVQTITGAAQMNDARLDALAHVETPYCFFLDDDDELPGDYLSVLDECRAAGKAVAYTNEIVRASAGDSIRNPGQYDQLVHAKNPIFIHHLALMETQAARDAASRCPRGMHYPEMTLYFQLAEIGTAHIDRIGYIWNKGDSGAHAWPSTIAAQVNSMTWAHREIRT